MEIEKLKVENDRLKLESQASGSQESSQVSVYNPTLTPTPGLSQHSFNLTESTSFGMSIHVLFCYFFPKFCFVAICENKIIKAHYRSSLSSFRHVVG